MILTIYTKYFTDSFSISDYRHCQGPDTCITYQLIDENSTRKTAQEVSDYLDNLRQKGLLDIDGNGKADALTDGLLLMRYMANYRGEDLIENTVDIWNGTRKTAEEIVEFIEGAGI